MRKIKSLQNSILRHDHKKATKQQVNLSTFLCVYFFHSWNHASEK